MSGFIGTKLTMNLGERSYDIIIKSGSLENLYQFARLDRRVAVVTDSGVPAQYAQRVADQCKDAKIITVPQGEGSKSFKILETVLRQMLEFNMGRGDLVIAVGGGVVGDLGGVLLAGRVEVAHRADAAVSRALSNVGRLRLRLCGGRRLVLGRGPLARRFLRVVDLVLLVHCDGLSPLMLNNTSHSNAAGRRGLPRGHSSQP